MAGKNRIAGVNLKNLRQYGFRFLVGTLLLGMTVLVLSKCEQDSLEDRAKQLAAETKFQENKSAWASLGAPVLVDFLAGLEFDETISIQRRLLSDARVLICNPLLNATYIDEDGQTGVAEILTVGRLSGAIGVQLKWTVRSPDTSSPLFSKKPPGTIAGCILVHLGKSASVKDSGGVFSEHIHVEAFTNGDIFDFNSPPDSIN